ncbi:MAG TPA: hypothetical protein VKB09_08980 [Thermomicrobiales bacterium]|nr:hypothetical protein [Thermomicrobiales bacterium]
MVKLRDLKTTEVYEQLEEIDHAEVERLWFVRHVPSTHAIASYRGQKFCAQAVPARIRLCSPYRASRGHGWFVLVALTDEQFAEEEAWHREEERWQAKMNTGPEQEKHAAGRAWDHTVQGNERRTRKLGGNEIIGKVDGLW